MIGSHGGWKRNQSNEVQIRSIWIKSLELKEYQDLHWWVYVNGILKEQPKYVTDTNFIFHAKIFTNCILSYTITRVTVITELKK
jgi:hypothetical protein